VGREGSPTRTSRTGGVDARTFLKQGGKGSYYGGAGGTGKKKLGKFSREQKGDRGGGLAMRKQKPKRNEGCNIKHGDRRGLQKKRKKRKKTRLGYFQKEKRQTGNTINKQQEKGGRKEKNLY